MAQIYADKTLKGKIKSMHDDSKDVNLVYNIYNKVLFCNSFSFLHYILIVFFLLNEILSNLIHQI